MTINTSKVLNFACTNFRDLLILWSSFIFGGYDSPGLEKHQLMHNIRVTYFVIRCFICLLLNDEDVFHVRGIICKQVYVLLATFLKCNISWRKKSQLLDFTDKEIKIINIMLQNFVNLSKVHEIRKLFYPFNLKTLR